MREWRNSQPGTVSGLKISPCPAQGTQRTSGSRIGGFSGWNRRRRRCWRRHGCIAAVVKAGEIILDRFYRCGVLHLRGIKPALCGRGIGLGASVGVGPLRKVRLRRIPNQIRAYRRSICRNWLALYFSYGGEAGNDAGEHHFLAGLAASDFSSSPRSAICLSSRSRSAWS